MFVHVNTKKFGRLNLQNRFIINGNIEILIMYRFSMRAKDTKVSFGKIKRQSIGSEPVSDSLKLGVH